MQVRLPQRGHRSRLRGCHGGTGQSVIVIRKRKSKLSVALKKFTTLFLLPVMNTAGLRLASSSRSTAFTASKTCQTTWAPRRRLHTRKELPYKIEDGLGNFMSPRTLQMVAVEYQQGLLDRLNEECRGKPRRTNAHDLDSNTRNADVEDKRKTVAQLVLDTARSQDRSIMFKYASHALNNSFFLNSLVGSSVSIRRVSPSLAEMIFLATPIRGHGRKAH